MENSDSQTDEPIRPRLWNPNAAAGWSLLFTPAFGARLHAANWRVLGQPERSAANMAWVWVTMVFLAINVFTVFLPDSKAVDMITQAAGIGLLVGWYVTQGKSQARYVTEELRDDYIRKGWGMPLLAGFAAAGAYIAVIAIIVFATYKPDASDIADEVKPLILQEWQKKPELRGATIQNITLVHKGGNNYSGFVDASFGNKPERLMLDVTYDGLTISWELKVPES